MEVGHTANRRVRLLYNDYGSDGYWIWKCLIDTAYGKHGYFFPCTQDDIELIAVDICRKAPELIWQVIESCVRRGLFDQHVYEKCHILTNDKMQYNFLRGTYDRRRKGAIVTLQEKHFLLDINNLTGLGDKYLDKVVFTDSGFTLRKKMDDSGDSLFSTGKHNASTGKSQMTAEIPEIPLQDRDRDRDRDYISTNVENADASPIGLKSTDNEKPEDLAKKSSAGKKKVARKKKGRDPDAEPYWHVLRRKWVDFNRTHLKFNVEPIPTGDYSSMHRIIEKLRIRATDQGVPWTEQEAVVRWEKFLSAAYNEDRWLHENFDLKCLEAKQQVVYQIIENGRAKTHKGVNGNTTKSTSDSKISALANWSIPVSPSDTTGKDKKRG